MADKFSRFNGAVTIRKKDDSMNMLMKHWISNFGGPHYICSDNGGEFIRDSFYDMYRNFNIKVSGTASFIPWSNDTCERNIHLTTMLLKIDDDVKCSHERISVGNKYKNRPLQIVFGKKKQLPKHDINDTLPALEKVTNSADLALHIATSHSTREAFMKAQTSEKIKTALKSTLDIHEKIMKSAR